MKKVSTRPHIGATKSPAHAQQQLVAPVTAAPLQGLDRTQFLIALEIIAEQCHSLAQLLMAAERNADALSSQDLITHISVAANAVKGIGALADSTSGSSVYGGLHTWMCGPNFSRDDKAVQA